MNGKTVFAWLTIVVACFSGTLLAQPPGGGPGGPGGPGPGGEVREILNDFDADENGWLDSRERSSARKFIRENPSIQRGPGGGRGMPPEGEPPGFGLPGFGPRGFGPPGPPPPEGRGGGGPPGPGRNRKPASPGVRVDKSSVQPLDAPLYDSGVLRTIFIDFENRDWESELEDFRGTDVDVPATLTVDGREYRNCGVHFRGASSYFMVPAGYKRSLNISMDLAEKDQRLRGYRTLNLLNGASDESMMSTVLYSRIAARAGLKVPKANFVRVVINGENWGIYTNVQQFNKDFLKENYGTENGARWKVAGSPRGGGGLDYRGDNRNKYEYPYEQKSGGREAQERLIELCRILDQSTPEQLPERLESIVDVDELLMFLALDIASINNDGYWVRASDYNIFLDENGKFHFIPHDMNEAFRGAGGGRGGPPGRPGRGERGESGRGSGELRAERPASSGQSHLALDPLTGMNDPGKPLRSKVLAVPQYRNQYLANIRRIAEQELVWDRIGPFVASQVELIGEELKIETRSPGSYEMFQAAVSERAGGAAAAKPRSGGQGPGSMNLQEFVEGRSSFLLGLLEK